MLNSAGYTHGNTRLRVALVLESKDIPRWVCETVKQLKATGKIDVAAVLVAPAKPNSKARNILRRWLIAQSTRGLRTGDGPLAERSLLRDIPVIEASEEGQFPSRDTYDVIVHLGSEALPKWVFGHASVWWFEYDGLPLESATALLASMVAKHHTHELSLRSSETTLFRCSYHVHPLSLAWNIQSDAWRRSNILVRALSRFVPGEPRNAVSRPPQESANSLACLSAASLLWFIPRWLAGAARHVIEKFWYRPTWCLAFFPRETLTQGSGSRFTLMWPPAGYNYADPFLFACNGRTYVFFERWRQNGGRGSVWCAEINGNGVPGKPREVLARPYHLSYPFVFEWQGEMYMLPETWDNKTIEVYRAVDFPWRWEHAGVLFDDFRAVDPTLVEHNGKLWLFASGVGGAKDTEGTELSIFYSDSLFGEWHAHPKNPVVCDIHSARPAGTMFRCGDMLIRPAQDGSVEYGYAITLNRIEVLSETDYREVPFSRILPDWIPGIHATHTLNHEGQIGVLDANARLSRLSWLRPKPDTIAGTAAAQFRAYLSTASNRLGALHPAPVSVCQPLAEQRRSS